MGTLVPPGRFTSTCGAAGGMHTAKRPRASVTMLFGILEPAGVPGRLAVEGRFAVFGAATAALGSLPALRIMVEAGSPPAFRSTDTQSTGGPGVICGGLCF